MEALLEQWRGHQPGVVAFANVVLASHLIGSPIGRIVNRFRVLNSVTAVAMEDALYDAGIALDYRRLESKYPLTAAAAAIARHAPPFGPKGGGACR
jgi:hypothetical protein